MVSLTYRILFHKSCHLLIEITIGHAPKFVSTDYFCGNLVTIVLLIELYHMVPFVLIVSHMVSVYSRGPQTAGPMSE